MSKEMMSKKRHVNRCTYFTRSNFLWKVCCAKRLHTLFLVSSVMVSTLYFIVLSPSDIRFEETLYLSPKTQRKLAVEHGKQDGGIFQAFIQYSGNISYFRGGFFRQKVLDSTRYIPELEPANKTKPKDNLLGDFGKNENVFLDHINVTDIPFNKTAFGSNYTLNDTRSDIYDFPYIINGSDICQTPSQPFLVIMVLSVHTHIDTRSSIRNTWGRAAKPGVWPKVGNLKYNVKLVFLFGMASNDLGNKIVKEESKMHSDVIQADFVDSYFNLTYKTVFGIRWVAEFCPNAKYILKADEDVFVHVHNLVNFLSKKAEKKRGVIYGHALMKSDVFREGRWAVSAHAFPLSVYPTYTCGNTYVISGKMAAHIYYTAGLLPYLNIEDVFVTGIVRTFLNAELVDVPGFTHWFEKKPRPCEFKNTVRISATKVNDYMQMDIWEGLKTKEADCYKPVKVSHVKTNRPERVIRQKLMRDEHVFMNKTNGEFYIV